MIVVTIIGAGAGSATGTGTRAGTQAGTGSSRLLDPRIAARALSILASRLPGTRGSRGRNSHSNTPPGPFAAWRGCSEAGMARAARERERERESKQHIL